MHDTILGEPEKASGRGWMEMNSREIREGKNRQC